MPRVPTANELGNVRLQALPGTQKRTAASPNLLAGGQTQQLGELGGAVQDAGQGVGSLLTNLQERERERKLNELRVETQDFVNTTTRELQSLEGKNAEGATAKLNERLTKYRQAKVEEVEDPEVRQRFEQEFTKLAVDTEDSVARHESRERRQAFNETAKARVAVATQNAAVMADDPQLVNDNYHEVDAGLNQLADANGWGEERLAYERAKAYDQFHREVAQAKLTRLGPDEAQRYLERNRDEMTADSARRIDKQIEEASRRTEAQQWTDRILSQNLSDQEQLRLARDEVGDPETRDEVVRRVKRRQAEQKQFVEQRRRQAMNSGMGIILDDGGSTDDIPLEDWERMTPQQRQKLRSLEAKVAGGGEVETDFKAYYQLRRMANNEPRKFANLNLAEYRDRLAGTEFKELARLQDDAAGGGGGAGDSGESAYVRSKQDIVDQQLAQMGYDPGQLEKADGEEPRAFARRVDEELERIRQQTGEPPSTEKVQEVVDRLSTEVVRKKSMMGIDSAWPDDSEPAFQAGEIEGVPNQLVDELAYSLEEGGREPTVQNIQRLYEELSRRGKL
jgi:hypothetical protein